MKAQNKHLAALLVSILAPLAAAAQSFSADVIMHAPNGKTTRSKPYRAANMVRWEMGPISPQAGPMIFLVDLEKQIVYGISEREKLVVVSHGNTAAGIYPLAYLAGGSPCAPTGGAQFPLCKQLGEETVNGRRTLKLELTTTWHGRTNTVNFWFDPKLFVDLKLQYGAGSYELQNVQESSQPASLFIVPTGYRQVDNR